MAKTTKAKVKMNPDSKAARFLSELKAQYPNEGEEKLFARFLEAVSKDPDLQRSALEDTFHSLKDELYDEVARTGREIPDGLKKPN